MNQGNQSFITLLLIPTYGDIRERLTLLLTLFLLRAAKEKQKAKVIQKKTQKVLICVF